MFNFFRKKMIGESIYKIDFTINKNDKIPIIHAKDCFGSKFSIRIDKPEYVNNEKGEEALFVGEIKNVVKILKSTNEDYGKSIWDWLRREWNIENPERRVPKMKMPNYIELEKYNLNLSQYDIASKCESENATEEELERTFEKIKKILISLNKDPKYVYINKEKKRIGYLCEYTRKLVCDYIMAEVGSN
jgi:hypothetical protein